MTRIPCFWIEPGVSNKANRHYCCGCSACEGVCANKAITMMPDQEGFLYPVVDNSLCVECGLCSSICPVSVSNAENMGFLKTLAGYTTNTELLNKCATGGVGTALALSIIRKGGVVFGVQYSESFKTTEYAMASTVEDILKFAGSKYIQTSKSEIFAKVKEQLVSGKLVLFTGCPCDIAGLKNYLKKDYERLFTCELICAGITSAKVLSDYWRYSEKKNGRVLMKINMRHKLRGWFITSLEETFSDGFKKYKNFYGTYLGHAFLTFPRPSCLHCQFRGTVSKADIKIGDFWGIKETDEFWNPYGTSVIFVRTKKGLDALNDLEEFKLFETSYQYAIAGNPSAIKNHGQYYVQLRDRFEHKYILEDKGLIAACKATASAGFWIKHFMPDSLHFRMKKMRHAFIDRKRRICQK